jgi:hypothetical protein
MTLGSLVTLQQFVVGSDYMVNLWYVSAAVFLFVRTQEIASGRTSRAVAAIFLALALSSRPVYPLTFIPLIIAYLHQRIGLRRGLLATAVPLALAAAITVPFYLYDPAHFSPLHIQSKLDFLSPDRAHDVLLLLPMAALLVACCGFLVRLCLMRLYLIAGFASGVILLTPAVLSALSQPREPLWPLLGYGNVAAMLIAMWAFSQLEQLPIGVYEVPATAPLATGTR